MSPPRVNSWRVFLAIWRLGLLRWSRRLLGRLRPLKRRSDLPRKRRPTPRKAGWSPALAAVLSVPFLLVIVTNGSQLVGRLSRTLASAKEPDKMRISRELREWLKSKEKMAAPASAATEQAPPATQSQSAPSTAAVRAQRQRVLDELQEQVDEEFFSPSPERHGGGQAAKERFTALYLERGVSAFRSTRPYPPDAFPRRALWPSADLVNPMLAALAVIMTGVFLFVLCNALHASQDVAGGRWDMEWLFSLPLPARTIFLADLAKEVVSNPASWVIPAPFMWVVLFIAGYSWWAAIPLALVSGGFIVVLAEAIRLPVEVTLRRRLRPDRLRNLLAAVGVVSITMLIGLVAMAAAGVGVEPLARLARVLPPAVIAVPWALPLALCHRSLPAAATLAAMVAVAAGVVSAAGALAERAVRRGLIAQGAGLTGRRRASRGERAGLPLRGVAGKELLLLARDRNYLVRTLILPVGLALFQVLINPAMVHGAQHNLQHAGALAFGLSAYMLLMSGTRLIIHEGKGLWLLYTFPKTLDRILLGKAVLWSAAAIVLGAAILLGTGGRAAGGWWPLLEVWVTALGGVWLFGMISAAVGALACDPQETRENKQVPPAALYLLMLIAGLYVSCFYVPSPYAKAVTMTVFALVAVAFWQKARARLPYLLDPVSRPPPSLDVADALIAAFAFFTIQGVVTILMLIVTPATLQQALVLGYSLSAIVVGLLSMLILGARRIPNLLEQVGLAWPRRGLAAMNRAAALGLAMGVLAAGFAAGYLWVVAHIPSLRPHLEAPTVWSQAAWSDWRWLVVLMVVGAPICEEYLFRGLLLRSLQRHAGLVRAAVFSSLVFALMHPPIAFLPVFVLGLAAAVSFGRSRSLLAPILAHMVYNALLVLPTTLLR